MNIIYEIESRPIATGNEYKGFVSIELENGIGTTIYDTEWLTDRIEVYHDLTQFIKGIIKQSISTKLEILDEVKDILED